jgi:hypothetical protein
MSSRQTMQTAVEYRFEFSPEKCPHLRLFTIERINRALVLTEDDLAAIF